eukprot:CAMPEP_0197195936 /NCGR_PEP_ID=MMETSP1423-20130617/32088_1 /TAXON_ID=476441 /ORGANISM="Pseudo-nitzschia heimii, Strain UNC1101" /LENGTH=134 /DNA_ID=CAMNT_0042649699 /DNA_START=345 /DNA_END=749 /DNA_ORIENTATION=-
MKTTFFFFAFLLALASLASIDARLQLNRGALRRETLTERRLESKSKDKSKKSKSKDKSKKSKSKGKGDKSKKSKSKDKAKGSKKSKDKAARNGPPLQGKTRDAVIAALTGQGGYTGNMTPEETAKVIAELGGPQ